MAGYPIILSLNGRTALVVGLGSVGRRKAAGLLVAGARVVGVDPRFQAGDDDEVRDDSLAGIEIVSEAYRAEHLVGVHLAVAAAPAEVNRQVVADARRLGVWVNSTTEPDEGDFSVPAVWSSGPLVLAVSTSGASPALAAVLRDRAAAALGPAAVELTRVLAEFRPMVRDRLADPLARQRVLREWADPRWLRLCAEHGPDAVREALAALVRSEEA